MDFLELAQNRYSCRSFKDKPIEQGKIDKLLKAAQASPTARNFQPQRILVLTDETERAKLSECTKYGWGAPVIMIICYDKEVSGKNRYDGYDFGTIDASIVTTHLMFEATSLGLGTTWVGAFDGKKVREVYNVPNNYEIIAILPIGYPSDEAMPSTLHTSREPLRKTVFFNKF